MLSRGASEPPLMATNSPYSSAYGLTQGCPIGRCHAQIELSLAFDCCSLDVLNSIGWYYIELRISTAILRISKNSSAATSARPPTVLQSTVYKTLGVRSPSLSSC